MRYFTLFSIPFLLFCFLIAGCGTDATPPSLENGTFRKVQEVPSTNIETLNSNGTLLLAGSSEGAYKKRLDRPEESWAFTGLDIDSAKVVDFVYLDEQNLLAAIMYDEVRTNKPTLFKSSDEGVNWSSMNISKPEELDFFVIHDLEKQMGSSANLFAYVGRIVRSTDGGNTWEIVYEEGGFSTFLTIFKFHPNKVWTGGTVTIFAPYLAKSEDGGDNWTLLNDNFYFNSDATVYDLVVHPNDANRVLAGVGGAVEPANVVRKSTDGGQSWRTVLEGYNIQTLAHSARDGRRVYASGINPARSPFFAASTNFGDDWQVVEMTDAPEALFINDIISVMEGGTEVLYLATTKGVYSYTFEQ